MNGLKTSQTVHGINKVFVNMHELVDGGDLVGHVVEEAALAQPVYRDLPQQPQPTVQQVYDRRTHLVMNQTKNASEQRHPVPFFS